MGRVRENIEAKGRKCWTMFDTGARNSYVVPKLAALLVTSKLAKPFRTSLGGSVKKAKRTALLEGIVEGFRFSTHAMVLDKSGEDEDGKQIEILFDALAMQQWGIRPIPDQEKLEIDLVRTL